MFAGCCWWRSLAIDGGSGTSRGHGSVMRRPGSRWDGAVERPSLFRPDVSQVGRATCERSALLPVADSSRGLLLLLSPLLSFAPARPRLATFPPGCGPWAPPLPPIGLTAADPMSSAPSWRSSCAWRCRRRCSSGPASRTRLSSWVTRPRRQPQDRTVSSSFSSCLHEIHSAPIASSPWEQQRPLTAPEAADPISRIVRSTRLYSVAAVVSSQDHSAYVPDHG